MAGLGLVSGGSSTRPFDRYGTITRESREPAITYAEESTPPTHKHSVIYPPSSLVENSWPGGQCCVQ